MKIEAVDAGLRQPGSFFSAVQEESANVKAQNFDAILGAKRYPQDL